MSSDKKPYKIPTDTAKIAEMLEATKWAFDFSFKQINMIAENLEVMRAGDGVIIFKEGDIKRFMAILVEGQVDVYKSHHNQNPVPLAKLSPPQTIGEMSLIDGEPRSATAVARGEVTMLIFTRETFYGLAEKSPEMSLRLLARIAKMISKRLRRTSGHFLESLSEDLDFKRPLS